MARTELMRAADVYEAIAERVRGAGYFAIARRMGVPRCAVVEFLRDGAERASLSDLVHFGRAVGVEVCAVVEEER